MEGAPSRRSLASARARVGARLTSGCGRPAASGPPPLGVTALLLLFVPLALLGLFAAALLSSPNSSTFVVAGLVGAFAYVNLLFTIGARTDTSDQTPPNHH